MSLLTGTVIWIHDSNVSGNGHFRKIHINEYLFSSRIYVKLLDNFNQIFSIQLFVRYLNIFIFARDNGFNWFFPYISIDYQASLSTWKVYNS
jgi:hypothetical protein